MKNVLKTLLILLFISLLLLLTYKVISKIKHKNEVTQNIKSIPKFLFEDVNGELFSNQNLKQNSATIFIYFNTECEFCNSEAKIIQENLAKFDNTEFVFISFEKPEKIKSFAETYELMNYYNIHFLYDKQNSFASTFDVAGLPTIVIYDEQKQLIEKIKGQIKIDHILQKLKKP